MPINHVEVGDETHGWIGLDLDLDWNESVHLCRNVQKIYSLA